MLASLIAVLILLLLSAFFSGSETALTGASSAFMHDKEKRDNSLRAKIINKLFESRDKLIITTLIGSNLANTLATALSTSLLISIFGREGVAYATIIMTFLVLIYTDMLPKTYSVQNANRVALHVAPFIKFWVVLFSPLTWLLQKVLMFSCWIFRIENKADNNLNNALSELRGAIYLIDDEKVAEEKNMLESVLDLADIPVYDVMNHRSNLFAVDIKTPVKKILNQIKTCPYSRIPVYKDSIDNIVGVFRVKALLQECVSHNNDLSKVKLQNVMTQPWFIPDNTSLLQQLQLFKARREHFAIVVDEYGDLQGIITLEDILEEIVGDINDESDMGSMDIMGIRKLAENSYLIDGQVPLRDLNRKFGWELQDEHSATLAGYLLEATRTIPMQGQKFIFDNFEFVVVKRNNNQLSQIKVTKIC